MKQRETIVIALGGNALIKKGEPPTITNQFKNTHKALSSLIPLVKKNNIVLTHGNGFQVGNILLRVEAALGKAYTIPLELCVAESQGEIGYMMEQTLQNVLHKHKIKKPVVSILTQVVVNKNDPAFKNPTKPIGPFYTKAQATQLTKKGFTLVEQKGRGWRKVVPSPKPQSIDDVEIISTLLKQNAVVIAAGGGGVPIVKARNKPQHGVPAVIDKDLASACLANAINADKLIIIMSEPNVYLNYATKRKKGLKTLTIKEAQQYAKEGQFPPGSMGPKIQAAINFLTKSKKKNAQVILTSGSMLAKALRGKGGTTITRR